MTAQQSDDKFLTRLVAIVEEEKAARILFTGLLIGTLLASLVAVIASDWLRAISIIVQVVLVALLMGLLARAPEYKRLAVDESALGVAPMQRLLSIMQGLLLLLYNAGIMVVVFAFLLGAGVINFRIGAGLLIWGPLSIAGFLFLAVMVAQMRIWEHGRIRPTWYSRIASALTALLGLLAVTVALVFVTNPSASIGVLKLGEGAVLTTVLIFSLSAATYLFFIANIPTAYDFIIRMFDKPEDEQSRAQTPPLVYATLFALAALFLVGYAVTSSGLVQTVGDALSSEQGAYILILLPVALVAFSVYSAVNIYRHGRVGLYKKKLPTKLRNDIIVYGTTAVFGGIFSVASFMVITERWTSIFGLEIGLDTAKDLIMLTILATVAPTGIYLTKIARRIDNIETRLGDFLNDLAEARRVGLTMTAALHNAARTDYGDLSEEVRKMSHQVAWGISFTEALKLFSQRVKSSLVQRSANLIIESHRSGGSVAGILKAAADDAREIKALEAERRINLSTYLIVIYVTFFVFLAVIGVMDATFIPQAVEAQQKVLASSQEFGTAAAVSSTLLDEPALRFAYFNAAMVQSIGNGTIGGLLMHRRASGGFIHIAIMAVAAWVLFRFILAF